MFGLPAQVWPERDSHRRLALGREKEPFEITLSLYDYSPDAVKRAEDMGVTSVQRSAWLDENGRDLKVKVDPGSLEIVKMKREGQDEDDDDNGSSRLQAAPAGMVAPPSNGLFGKGAPKAEVK